MAELRDAYLAAKVVSARWSNDAAHVAAATVARAGLSREQELDYFHRAAAEFRAEIKRLREERATGQRAP
jgi:hypothetical protein